MRKYVVAGMVSALAALVLGAGGPALAQSTPTGKAAAIVEPSIVFIEQQWTARVWAPATTEYTSGYLSSEPFTFATRCTGFVINPDGYIATAGHCVDPGKTQGAAGTAITNFGIAQFLAIRDLSVTEENVSWVYENFDPLNLWKVHGATKGSPPGLEVTVQHGVAAGGVDTGEALSARVIDFTSWAAGDVALLKVESSNPLPAVELATKDSIEIGTRVISTGYPGAADDVTDASYEPTFQDGQINSQKTREGGQLPVYEISSEMSGGMSGGPTVDMSGRVVGINSFEHAEETSFDFITPVSLLNEMLSQNGVEAKLGPNDTAYRAGLQAFFAKDYNRAAFELQRVTSLAPEHKLAQEYLQKALANGGIAAEGDPANQGMPMATILGAVAGVLALGGGAAWFLMRRRRRGASAAPGTAAQLPPEMAPPVMAEATVGNGHAAGNGHAEGNGHGEIAAPVALRPRRKSPAKSPTATAAKKSTATRAKATTSAAAKPAGAKATATRRAGKFCPECGNKNTASAKFCENCGHSF